MMNETARTNELLAGVCSRLAHIFHCNVWVLRAIFIILLLAKTLMTIIAYGALALLFQGAQRMRKSEPPAQEQPPLGSSQLAERNRKIEELDRRFRDWEDSLNS